MNEGFIRITSGAWKEIGEPKLWKVKERLLLPAEYEVCATTYTYDHGIEYVDISVVSESIPEPECFGAVRLMPVYRKIDQTPEFVRMEVIKDARK